MRRVGDLAAVRMLATLARWSLILKTRLRRCAQSIATCFADYSILERGLR
jgi:hypothetical protein